MAIGSCGADDRTPEHGGREANLERSSPDRDESVFDAEDAKVVADQGNQGNDEATRCGARRERIESQSRACRGWRAGFRHFGLRAAHSVMRGSTAIVRGLRQAVLLDLRTCGSRQSESRKMLPQLEHVMQHCSLYLVVEYEWSSVPGPALEVCKGGEIRMTPPQQEYFDERFMTLADRVEHARIFTRMELRCKDGQDKVS